MDLPIKKWAASLLFFSLAAPAQTPKSAEAVLSAYVQALGGLPAIDTINTRQVTGSRGLLGKVEYFWQKPDKVLLLSGKEKTAYNGSSGWFYSKRKRLARLSKGAQVPLEIDANPLRYARLNQLYSEIDPAPQKTIDDTLMDVLVAPNDLAQTILYFDAHTHLLARIDEKGDTSAYFTSTTWFEEYKAVDGVQFPFLITHKTTDKGAASEVFKIKAIKNNVVLNPEIFSKPQSTNLVLGGKR